MDEPKHEQNGLRIVGIAGSPVPQSKARTLVERALAHFNDLHSCTDFISLAEIPADALMFRDKSPELDAALNLVARASILVVGTPVYKAAYTGILKCFFDNFPQRALVGKIAIPIAVGGSANHLLALDHALRPLLASEGAVTTGRGVYAVDAEFHEGHPNESVSARILTAVNEATALARGLRAMNADEELA